MNNIELTFIILGGIGSFLSGIIVLITFIRIVTKLQIKEQVIYGNEADEQYKEFEKKEHKGIKKLPTYQYQGGNIIVPRLQIEKFVYNPIIMDSGLSKFKQTVLYFDKDKNVTTWYLK